MQYTSDQTIKAALAGLGAAAFLSFSACGSMESTPGTAPIMMAKPAVPKDGEIQVGMEYKNWPRFLTGIDKEQVKQVRDIYINSAGARTMAGRDFPNGTMMAMEIYKAKENADGSLVKGEDGKLVKGDLAKVFIMAKGEGWGQTVPDNLKNGAWVYSAIGPDGKPLAEDFAKCRACHVPLAQKDFVHRYDEYFEKRGQM
ncbi:MAG: cytochrome P460 family protein [Nitrospiraceae bacterium]